MLRWRDREWRVHPGGRTPDRRSPVRVARLSDVPLPDLDPAGTPWPARTIMVDGCGVRVRHTPGPAGGQTAVYVHGLGGDATNFTDLAGLLAPWLDGHSVDLPGFGGSDPAPGGNYSLRGQARVLTRVVDILTETRGGGPVHLFGNSMGGVVALLAAAARPDQVRTLTLISPAMPALLPRRGPVGQMQLLLLPGVGRLAERQLARFTPRERAHGLVTVCFGDPSLVPDHRLADTAREISRRATLPWAMPAMVGSIRGLAACYLASGSRSLWRQANRIVAPALVVWGDRDRLVDVAFAPRTARAIPDSRLLVLPGVGHTAQIEDPTSVARAFLSLREDASSSPHDLTSAGSERTTR